MVPRIRPNALPEGSAGSGRSVGGTTFREMFEVHAQGYGCGGGLWSAMGYCSPVPYPRRRYVHLSETNVNFNFQDRMDTVPEDDSWMEEDAMKYPVLTTTRAELACERGRIERANSNVSSLFLEESLAGDLDEDLGSIFIADSPPAPQEWAGQWDWSSPGSYCGGVTHMPREFRGKSRERVDVDPNGAPTEADASDGWRPSRRAALPRSFQL
mmetsp:Transcript_1501/g.2687  ORF Transcript_1501/g.2687 Transcript_1501/m.2687 type:complete len:212 (-) Transcript_1501:53-688(-)